jgi:hypothetical protein
LHFKELAYQNALTQITLIVKIQAIHQLPRLGIIFCELSVMTITRAENTHASSYIFPPVFLLASAGLASLPHFAGNRRLHSLQPTQID